MLFAEDEALCLVLRVVLQQAAMRARVCRPVLCLLVLRLRRCDEPVCGGGSLAVPAC